MSERFDAEANRIFGEATQIVDQVMEAGKVALDGAQKIFAEAGSKMKEAVESARQVTMERPMSSEDLETFAAAFPQWAVSTGIRSGKAFKHYSRSFDDFGLASVLGRFCDPEHFDQGLLDIFESYSASGDAGTNGRFTIFAEKAGPVSYADQDKITAAEAYLRTSGVLVSDETDVA